MFSQSFKAMLSGVITRGSTEVMIGKNMAIFQRDIQHLSVNPRTSQNRGGAVAQD